MIHIVIPGECQAQERVRFVNRGKYVHTYDPPKSAKYKQYVAQVALMEKLNEPLEGALIVEIYVYRSIPKSFSNKKRELAIEGKIRPTSKPDTDNYVKSILDGLNGIIWKDDAQIVRLVAEKYYSDNPRAEVIIKLIE
jgi:Holliday junction resolvase RusA-like endonuclease